MGGSYLMVGGEFRKSPKARALGADSTRRD